MKQPRKKTLRDKKRERLGKVPEWLRDELNRLRLPVGKTYTYVKEVRR